MAYYHGPHITGQYIPLYTKKTRFFSLLKLKKHMTWPRSSSRNKCFCGRGRPFFHQVVQGWWMFFGGGRVAWWEGTKGMWLYRPTLPSYVTATQQLINSHFNKLVATRIYQEKKTSNYIEIYLEPK